MWTIGTLVWFPVCVLITLALVGAGVWLWRHDWDPVDQPFARGIGVACWVVASLLIIGIASPIGMWPYKAEYHRYDEKTGVVTAVNKRLISSGKSSMEQKFVVRFQGSRQEYGCEDTRCSVIDVGDQVTLACLRAWQYAGTDGYDCNFVRNGGAQ